MGVGKFSEDYVHMSERSGYSSNMMGFKALHIMVTSLDKLAARIPPASVKYPIAVLSMKGVVNADKPYVELNAGDPDVEDPEVAR